MTEPTHERPLWQLAGLMAAFVALVIIGVYTVIIPELQDDPDADDAQQSAEPEESPAAATPAPTSAPAP